MVSVIREFETSLIGTLGNASWGRIFVLLLGERVQALPGRIYQSTGLVCAEVGVQVMILKSTKRLLGLLCHENGVNSLCVDPCFPIISSPFRTACTERKGRKEGMPATQHGWQYVVLAGSAIDSSCYISGTLWWNTSVNIDVKRRVIFLKPKIDLDFFKHTPYRICDLIQPKLFSFLTELSTPTQGWFGEQKWKKTGLFQNIF